MMAQRVNCYPTNFHVFAGQIVSGDHPLNFVAQGVINRALASNRRAARSLGTTPGFENFTTTARSHTTHFRGTLALG